MKISKFNATRLVKSLTLLLFDCAEHGDLPIEVFTEVLELLLRLEEITEAEDE